MRNADAHARMRSNPSGCYAGAVAVAYTYANGFFQLYKKNRMGWSNTFRHRMLILVSHSGGGHRVAPGQSCNFTACPYGPIVAR